MSSQRAARVAGLMLTFALLCGLTACGEEGGGAQAPRSSTSAAAAPALTTQPRRDGEIVVRGEASPRTHGPYAFDGRYVVRFVQYAPEDPRLDFGAQTAFVASTGPARPGPGGRHVRLFRVAARDGRRTIELHGEHVVEVEFGDFPYAIRFTPAR